MQPQQAVASIYGDQRQLIDGRSLYSLPVPVGSSIRGIVLGGGGGGGPGSVRSAQEVDALPVYREVMGESMVPRYYVEMSAVRSIGEMSGTGVRYQGSIHGEVCNNNNRGNEQVGEGGAVRPERARAVSDLSALGAGDEKREEAFGREEHEAAVVRYSWESRGRVGGGR